MDLSYIGDLIVSLCVILTAFKPERSKLTIIAFKSSTIVKFDIKLQNGTILPVDNVGYQNELKQRFARYSTQGIAEGRKCIEFVDKETQHVLKIEADNFCEDNEEEALTLS